MDDLFAALMEKLELKLPTVGRAYDWCAVLAIGCMTAGLYIDGWAHNTLDPIESFFTPWHALLYGGLGLVALQLIATAIFFSTRGYRFRQAMPAGYGLSLFGVALFAFGGVLDVMWHTLFGFEVNVDALLSPPHLLLFSSAMLIYLGPLRSAAAHDDTTGTWVNRGAAVFSLTWLLCLITFFTQFASPLSAATSVLARKPLGSPELFQGLGVSNIIAEAAILSAILLFAVKLGKLPRGSFTAIIGINALLQCIMSERYLSLSSVPPALLVAGMVAAGVVVDALYAALQPAPNRSLQLKLFGFAAPAVVYTIYFIVIRFTGGTWWSIHLLAGSVLMAGFTGLLASYLVLPAARD